MAGVSQAQTPAPVSSWQVPIPTSVSSLAILHREQGGHQRSLLGRVRTHREDDRLEARPDRERALVSDVRVQRAVVVGPCSIRRTNPLAFRAFDQPTSLRRRFARPGGAPFLSEGTPERELLDLLAARDGRGTEEGNGDLRASQLLLSIVKEPAQLPGFWGEDAAVDALRLRRLAETGAAESPWEGFLEWAGRALFQRTDPLPEPVLPAAAAAMAASGGWRRALDACLLRLPDGPLGRRSLQALASLTLRVALEGALVPAAVRWLIPGGDPLSSEESETWHTTAWRPALLALRAYHDHGNDAGVVHLTAGLVAGRFRRGFRTAARRRRMDVAVPCWGAPPLSATAQKALRRALVRLGDVDPWNLRGPWPFEWGGPNGPELEASLTRLLGGRSDLAPLVLLDDRLCLAAVWGLLGRPQSALAQLAGWKTAPIFAEAREALRRGLPGWPEAGLPPELPRGPDADDLFRTLASTPDPSVALGSPHWMLPGGRGAHTNRLLKQGRRDEARHLRTILDRPDVRQKLEPLWILTGPEDTASVVALARWLAVRVPSPSEREWLAFLEGQCRQRQLATS